MKVAVPRMGNLPPIARDPRSASDFDFMETPPFTEKTMETGAAGLAPEFACLAAQGGAGVVRGDARCWSGHAGDGRGHGPCRSGYYGEIQRRILEAKVTTSGCASSSRPQPSFGASTAASGRSSHPRTGRVAALARELRCVLSKVREVRHARSGRLRCGAWRSRRARSMAHSPTPGRSSRELLRIKRSGARGPKRRNVSAR